MKGEATTAARRAEDFRAVLADERAFRSWYRDALPYVYGYVLDRCARHSVAEELTQETFVEAIRNQHRFDGRSDPLTWMCAIAKHKLADHYRRLDREERRRLRLLGRGGGTDSGPEPQAARDAGGAARRALGSLPAMQRAVLVLRYLDELSVAEIGAVVGRSESAVESLLSRGRDGFRRAYLEPRERRDDGDR